MLNSRILIFGLLGVLVVTSMSVFTVSETEHAIRFRFREIIRDDFDPGLHFKLPWENVLKLDKRILTVDKRPSEFLTDQKEKVFVDFLVKWRIVDPGQFYRATGGLEQVASDRLLPIIEAGLKDDFASRQLSDVVSVERSAVMKSITDTASELAQQFGAEINDVRIKRIDLSEDVSATVYNRMRQERDRVAKQRRAEGRGEAERIRAEADKEETVILANAYKEAEQTRGDGDANAARIYAEAYERDPEFYSFFRSMQAYRRSFEKGSDVLVLNPDSPFFRYLNEPNQP
ncbi:MAG: protease modulator HflC [Gammaproteobacteria bacterium]